MNRITRVLILAAALAGALFAATACGSGHQAQPTLVPTPVFNPTAAPTLPPSNFTPSASTPTPAASADPQKGAQLAQSNGCTGCHSTTGGKIVGPTWKGLYGSKVTLTDGTTVTADDAYLKDSIVNPDAQVPQGFSKGIMPGDYGKKLSAGDIADVIAYIKTLQ